MARISPAFFATLDRVAGSVSGASSFLASAQGDLAGVRTAATSASSPLSRAASQLELGAELVTTARSSVTNAGLRSSITDARAGFAQLATDIRATAAGAGEASDAALTEQLTAHEARLKTLGTSVEELRTRAQQADIAAADAAPKGGAAAGNGGQTSKAKGAGFKGFIKQQPGMAMMGGMFLVFGGYLGVRKVISMFGDPPPTKAPAIPPSDHANTVDSVVGALLVAYDRHPDGTIHLDSKEYEVTDAEQTTAARRLLDAANADGNDEVTKGELETFVGGYDDGAGAPADKGDGKLSPSEYERFRHDWSDTPKSTTSGGN
jgi:hypothetical protein